MGDIDKELLQTFIEEVLEHVGDMERDLLAIEENGARMNEDIVNKVFRSAHTIKGNAGFVGLEQIATLAHRMEDVLGLIRKGQLIPNAENMNPLLLASDALKEMVSDPEANLKKDIRGQIEGLNAVVESTQASSVAASTPRGAQRGLDIPIPNGSRLTLNVSPDSLSEASSTGRTVYLIRVDGETETGKSSTPETLKRYGEVLSVTEDETADEKQAAYIVFACVLTAQDLSQLVNVNPHHLWILQADGEVRPIESTDEGTQTEDMLESFEIDSEEPDAVFEDALPPLGDVPDAPFRTAATAAENAKSAAAPTPDAKVAPPSTIRVSLPLLDSLMNMAGELVLSRNQLLQGLARDDAKATEAAGKSLDAITSELQETVMLTRMQPIGILFNRFHRMVRDLARELRKEVEIQMVGKTVELDRTLIENLSDPLTHLVRNSVDHGIEPAEERKKLGKGEIGRITLHAYHEAGQIHIDIRDDGKGIDPEQVAKAAVDQGFTTREQLETMGRKEKMNLIFTPGFSTTSTISSVSGRGVGMDVVKNNLNRLGGQVDIASQPRMGTTIHIKLPLTMAIIPGQVISVENRRFVIPQTNLVELLRIPADQVKQRLEWVGDAQVIRLRNQLLPLVRLADVLGIERTYTDPSLAAPRPDRRRNIADRRSRKTPLFGSKRKEKPDAPEATKRPIPRFQSDRRYRADSALNIAVLSTGLLRYGIIVDQFLDSEEIVVKPLGRHLKATRAYTGATIMGDGQVALILDSGDIAHIAELSSLDGTDRALEVAEATGESEVPEGDILDLLIFRNAEHERFVMPLSQVLHIERIESTAIQTYGRRRSIQYRGGNLPVFSIDETADVGALTRNKRLLVIVSRVAGRDVGLLAAGPVDAVHTSSRVDETSLKQPGILGSVIINHETALIVDLSDVIFHLYPEWISEDPEKVSDTETAGTLLLVEDSTFFRSQITSFLQNDGFAVMEAEDGLEAWGLLKNHAEEIDLIITDIEMPNMDGLELTRKIRSKDGLSTIPIIALTTLADDQDEEKGKTAGIDDYQIKLDKEKLMNSIKALLQKKGDSTTQ